MLNLDLIDPRQVVFDRVLGRDDFPVWAVQVVQGGVKRRGLSRTGRAGHQDDSIGTADQSLKDVERLFRETQAAGRRP